VSSKSLLAFLWCATVPFRQKDETHVFELLCAMQITHTIWNNQRVKTEVNMLAYMPSVIKKRSTTLPSGVVDTFTLWIKSSSSDSICVTSANHTAQSSQITISQTF
jgi:hypothetical protein